MNNANNRRQSPYDYSPPQRKPPGGRRPRKRKPSFAKYGFRILLFLIFFALISAFAGCIFFFSLTSLKEPGDIRYEIKILETKDKPVELALPYETGFRGEQFYFPINGIMEKMGFVLIGDKSEFTFLRAQSDESVKFLNNSASAYINGEKIMLPGPVFADGEDTVYAPVEFLKARFANLHIFPDEKNKNKLIIEIGKISGDFCFTARKAEMLPPVEELPGVGKVPVEFKSDVSAYEKYFDLPAGQADEYLVLINQNSPLEPQDYAPPDLLDLVDTRKDGRAMQQMRLWPAKALEAFLAEARANGFTNVTVTSAYRDYAYQSQLFREETARCGGDEDLAATAVARPGRSEHQSGLCADMHSLGSAAQNFGNEPDGKWLAENARYFGFIVRYPADKTDITGIQYEPWHFRYVGRRAAMKIYAEGLCLEQYHEKYLGR